MCLIFSPMPALAEDPAEQVSASSIACAPTPAPGCVPAVPASGTFAVPALTPVGELIINSMESVMLKCC